MKFPLKPIKRGAALFFVLLVALVFNRWRHPPLPDEISLPKGAHVVQSVRFLNPFLSGPALYYRIESLQSQRAAAAFFSGNSESTRETIQTFSGSAPALQRDFKSVNLRGSSADSVLVFSTGAQIFPVESESLCECRIWKTRSGSTTELLVWTNF